MEGFDAEGRKEGRLGGWMIEKERGIRDILEIIIELSFSNNRKKKVTNQFFVPGPLAHQLREYLLFFLVNPHHHHPMLRHMKPVMYPGMWWLSHSA